LKYLPGKLLVRGDAAATAAKILSSKTLFRLWAFDGLIAALLFLWLALVLYRLLKSVNPWQAMLMLVLVIIQTPVQIGSVASQMLALDALRGDTFWRALDKPQRDALAMLLLDVNNSGVCAVEMLWGLWLLPLGLLVFRSAFLPRVLGVWLWLNGIAYVALSTIGFLWPQLSRQAMTLSSPALFGELALTLWLLVVGARPKQAAPSLPAA